MIRGLPDLLVDFSHVIGSRGDEGNACTLAGLITKGDQIALTRTTLTSSVRLRSITAIMGLVVRDIVAFSTTIVPQMLERCQIVRNRACT